MREVRTPDGQIEMVEAYSLRETGEALGRPILTMRNWISAGNFPPAQLVDTTYGYDQWSRGELDVLVPILDGHFKANSQLQANHTETREALFNAIEQYRAEFI